MDAFRRKRLRAEVLFGWRRRHIGERSSVMTIRSLIANVTAIWTRFVRLCFCRGSKPLTNVDWWRSFVLVVARSSVTDDRWYRRLSNLSSSLRWLTSRMSSARCLCESSLVSLVAGFYSIHVAECILHLTWLLLLPVKRLKPLIFSYCILYDIINYSAGCSKNVQFYFWSQPFDERKKT